MSSNLLLLVKIRAIDFCILVLCPGTSLNLSYLTHSYYTLILSCSFWYNLMTPITSLRKEDFLQDHRKRSHILSKALTR